MPETDLQLLERAALEGGEIAMRYWRRDPQSWDKGSDQGPVSEADLAVNRHLEQVLRTARPDYAWLSEETPDDSSRLGAAHCFIIDPIDGTRAFLEGQEGFSLSLAIATGDRVTAGVVHLPARSQTYMADENTPATLNGARIGVQDHPIDGATALAGKVVLAPSNWKGQALPPMKREFRSSIAWRLALIAEGRFNATLALRPSWEWDLAAGSLIARQAGAAVTDRRGHALQFNQPTARLDGIVAAGPQLAAEILARLAA